MTDGGRGEAAWADAMLAAALLAVDPGLGGAVVRARPGPVRDVWLAELRRLSPPAAPWRRLPPGIDDERLLGGLDLAAALGGGRRVMQRGLLAEADGGIVVAAMAERLSASTAGRIATALQDGVVAVERDGAANRLDARFTLVALDEGAEADEQPPAALVERLAFRLDLDMVGVREATPVAATSADVAEARAALARAEPPDPADVEALCGAALALGADSLRAPMFALRAAQAMAALEGRTVIEADDLSVAARLVLAPRATRSPPSPQSADSADDATGAGESETVGQETSGPEQSLDADAETAPSLDEIVLTAALAALPDGLEALWGAGAAPRRGAPARSAGAGAAQRTLQRGRRIGVRPGLPRDGARLDLIATLKAAAPWQRMRSSAEAREPRLPLRIRRDDFRIRRFEQRAESTVIFVVDASGSAALHRLAEAKGAVELLLAEAYVRRTQVALIAFRGASANLMLPPTRSLTRARRTLAELAGGGATPLAAALEAGGALAVAERAKGRTPVLVVLTDGRGNIALDGAAFRTRAETDALNAARRIGLAKLSSALIDTSPRPRGDGARLAEAMGARFAPLPYVQAEAVRDVARALSPAKRG